MHQETSFDYEKVQGSQVGVFRSANRFLVYHIVQCTLSVTLVMVCVHLYVPVFSVLRGLQAVWRKCKRLVQKILSQLTWVCRSDPQCSSKPHQCLLPVWRVRFALSFKPACCVNVNNQYAWL